MREARQRPTTTTNTNTRLAVAYILWILPFSYHVGHARRNHIVCQEVEDTIRSKHGEAVVLVEGS